MGEYRVETATAQAAAETAVAGDEVTAAEIVAEGEPNIAETEPQIQQAIEDRVAQETQNAAAAVLSAKPLKLKPGKKTLREWLDSKAQSRALAQWVGPRRYIDKNGDMWFIGIAAAPVAEESAEQETNEQIADSCALALKNMLGLTCDPVAGLVEIPCIKRNVSGAVNAIIASQMAMAGIKSAIPADEVFETMGRIGNLIPPCLKETSQDGLAQTSTAQKVFEKLSSASGFSDN